MAKRRPKSRTPGSPPVLTPDHWKSGIDPKYLAAEIVQHTVGKGLDETYNFALDGNSIEGLLRKLWSFKVTGVQSYAISGLPGQNVHLDATPATSRRVYYREWGGGSLPSPGRGVSKWVRVHPWLSQHQKDPEWVLTTLCGFMQARVSE
jgi:hypothetical protein